MQFKGKKVIGDMLINIISSAIPTIVLQLCLLPLLSKYVTGDEYGLIVTILSLFNVVPSTIGMVLNNVRLLHENSYKESKISGDFQILLLISEVINILITFGLCCYYIGISNILDIILVIIVSVLWLGREYYIVAFRLKLDYKAILMNNLFLVIGYVIGYLLFTITSKWQFIYLVGLMISYIYIFIKSSIYREPYVKTKFFVKVSKDSLLLIIATFMARFINYADKMILYPLIGGTMVSVYYVSTIFSKVVSMAINPINSVALSYLSKMDKKPDKLFKQAYILGVIICIIGYVVSVLISRPVLQFIYPEYVDLAMNYIYITSATICVNVLTSIITPFVLKFFDMKWQIVINALTSVTYLILTLSLFYFFGMTGFCFGVLISNVIKLLTTTFIYKFKKERQV